MHNKNGYFRNSIIKTVQKYLRNPPQKQKINKKQFCGSPIL
jgi:hypothetical protein